MTLEEVEDDRTYTAAYHRVKGKEHLVNVLLPKEITEWLELPESGDLGFKKAKVRGKKRAVIGPVVPQL